jgi:hypothetical protein
MTKSNTRRSYGDAASMQAPPNRRGAERGSGVRVTRERWVIQRRNDASSGPARCGALRIEAQQRPSTAAIMRLGMLALRAGRANILHNGANMRVTNDVV